MHHRFWRCLCADLGGGALQECTQTGYYQSSLPLSPPLLLSHQSYQWLREKIVSEDGKKQQAKLKELSHITEKLGCTLPQLAVGKTSMTAVGAPPSSPLVDSLKCLMNQ